MAVKFTNNAATTLAAGINSSVTSIAVTDGSVFPTITGSDHFYVTFDDTTNKEIVKVTARSGNTLTVVRGHDNTTARAFSSGDKAELRIVAALLEDVKTDISSTLTVDTFTGDDSTTAFTLSVAPASEDNLIVFIEGVYQNPGDFTLSGTTLTLDVAPLAGRKIIVYHVSHLVAGNNLTHNQFTCNGSTTAFTLSLAPGSENNTQAFLDGVYQQKTDYAVSGTTLTMDTAPANGAILEVMTFTQTEVNTLPASFVSGLTQVTAVGADHFMIFDATDSALKKSLVSDVLESATSISTSADATAITIDSNEKVTFTSDVTTGGHLSVGGNNNELRFYEGSNYVGFEAPALSADKIWVLPAADGSSGQVLQTNGSGTLSFATVSGTTINNNADNRIITGSGTANTLNGESALTFDANGNLKVLAAGNTTTGGNIQLGITTDDAAKYTAITAQQHDSGTETEGFTLIGGNSAANDSNLVNIGGGFGEQNPATQIQFYTGSAATREGTVRMVVDPSGDVGIGTASPFTPLHVSKTDWSSGSPYGTVATIEGNNVNDNNWGHLIITDTTTSNGNGGSIRFASGSTSSLNPFAGIQGVAEGTSYGGVGIYTRPSGGTATERMRINSSGQTLINTTDGNMPTSGGNAPCVIYGGAGNGFTDNALHVGGGRISLNAQPNSNSTRGYVQCDGAGFKLWHVDNSDMIFGVNNSEKMRIHNASGRIRNIATYNNTAPATHRDVYVENNGDFGYASSVRAHKTNINSYGDASWLYSIDPKTFNYRKPNITVVTNDDGFESEVRDGTYSDTEYYNTVEVGFIAEDIEEHDANLCFYNELEDEDGNVTNELAGVHYKSMVVPMLKLIKEQKALIDNLTTRIETLEG